jgi:hypothetical protein
MDAHQRIDSSNIIILTSMPEPRALKCGYFLPMAKPSKRTTYSGMETDHIILWIAFDGL